MSKVARLADAEDRLLLKLARRREPSDNAFLAKTAYVLAAQTADIGSPTMHDPFGAVVIALGGISSNARKRALAARAGR